MLKFFATALLTCFVSTAWACSCGRIGIFRSHKGATFVFTGKLVAKQIYSYNDTVGVADGKVYTRPARLVRFTFQVQRWYKGTPQSDTISVSTSAGDADCGYVFGAGQSYLIYGWLTDALPNDFSKDYRKVKPYLTTSVCSRTRPKQYVSLYERALLSLL